MRMKIVYLPYRLVYERLPRNLVELNNLVKIVVFGDRYFSIDYQLYNNLSYVRHSNINYRNISQFFCNTMELFSDMNDINIDVEYYLDEETGLNIEPNKQISTHQAIQIHTRKQETINTYQLYQSDQTNMMEHLDVFMLIARYTQSDKNIDILSTSHSKRITESITENGNLDYLLQPNTINKILEHIKTANSDIRYSWLKNDAFVNLLSKEHIDTLIHQMETLDKFDLEEMIKNSLGILDKTDKKQKSDIINIVIKKQLEKILINSRHQPLAYSELRTILEEEKLKYDDMLSMRTILRNLMMEFDGQEITLLNERIKNTIYQTINDNKEIDIKQGKKSSSIEQTIMNYVYAIMAYVPIIHYLDDVEIDNIFNHIVEYHFFFLEDIFDNNNHFINRLSDKHIDKIIDQIEAHWKVNNTKSIIDRGNFVIKLNQKQIELLYSKIIKTKRINKLSKELFFKLNNNQQVNILELISEITNEEISNDGVISRGILCFLDELFDNNELIASRTRLSDKCFQQILEYVHCYLDYISDDIINRNEFINRLNQEQVESLYKMAINTNRLGKISCRISKILLNKLNTQQQQSIIELIANIQVESVSNQQFFSRISDDAKMKLVKIYIQKNHQNDNLNNITENQLIQDVMLCEDIDYKMMNLLFEEGHINIKSMIDINNQLEQKMGNYYQAQRYEITRILDIFRSNLYKLSTDNLEKLIRSILAKYIDQDYVDINQTESNWLLFFMYDKKMISKYNQNTIKMILELMVFYYNIIYSTTMIVETSYNKKEEENYDIKYPYLLVKKAKEILDEPENQNDKNRILRELATHPITKLQDFLLMLIDKH